MIDGIDDCFFDCLVGVIPKALGLGAVWMLDDGLVQVVVLYVGEGVAGDSLQRADEGFFAELVSVCTLREVDDIYLGGGEKAGRVFVEKQQADVFRKEHFGCPGYDIHLFCHGFQR